MYSLKTKIFDFLNPSKSDPVEAFLDSLEIDPPNFYDVAKRLLSAKEIRALLKDTEERIIFLVGETHSDAFCREIIKRFSESILKKTLSSNVLILTEGIISDLTITKTIKPNQTSGVLDCGSIKMALSTNQMFIKGLEDGEVDEIFISLVEKSEKFVPIWNNEDESENFKNQCLNEFTQLYVDFQCKIASRSANWVDANMMSFNEFFSQTTEEKKDWSSISASALRLIGNANDQTPGISFRNTDNIIWAQIIRNERSIRNQSKLTIVTVGEKHLLGDEYYKGLVQELAGPGMQLFYLTK